MIDSKSLSDRVLNLEDAAEYLSQKSGEKFFVNDLIGLILENQLRATCYLVQVALAQVSEEEVSRESMAFGYAEGYQLSGWHAIRSAYSSDLYEQSLADINVLNLQSGVLVKTTAKIFNEPPPDPFYKIQMLADERKENDRLYGREMLIREKLSKPELYNGVFELEMNKELSRWFKHIHAGIEPFDIEQLYFLSDDGQRFKRVYLEEFYQHGYKREQPSVTRLTLRDIKVYESDIKQLLEPPVQNAPSKDSMTLFLKHRVQVAEKYVVEHGEDHIKNLTTFEIWQELWVAASGLMSIDGDYNADRLFDQNVTEENMIKSLSTLRKVGVKIPKRKRKSRKQTEGGE